MSHRSKLCVIAILRDGNLNSYLRHSRRLGTTAHIWQRQYTLALRLVTLTERGGQMTAEIFALPSMPWSMSCLSPAPERDVAPLKEGARVIWEPDEEAGTLVAITEHAVAIDWDESGIEWYAETSGSIERIKPLRFTCRFKR